MEAYNERAGGAVKNDKCLTFVFGEKRTLGSSVLRDGCGCPGHRDTEGH